MHEFWLRLCHTALLCVLALTLPVMHAAKALAHYLDLRMTHLDAALLLARAGKRCNKAGRKTRANRQEGP